MHNKNIINFTARLNKKRDKEKLRECLAASGWEIDCDIESVDSEICIYLIDSQEDGIVLFGCKNSDLTRKTKTLPWNQFVLAWDVIADPGMPFDETHKRNTMDFALRALPGLSNWPAFSKNAFEVEDGKKLHILVIIDRSDMESPLELIVAHSNSPVMNSESVQAIIDSYASDK